MKAEWTNNDSLTTSQTTKAILVIDVQMTEDGKHICDSCPVWDEKGCMCKYDFMFLYKGCPLKPMPQKMRTDGDDIEEDSYWNGWNDCLAEITGETE